MDNMIQLFNTIQLLVITDKIQVTPSVLYSPLSCFPTPLSHPITLQQRFSTFLGWVRSNINLQPLVTICKCLMSDVPFLDEGQKR